jgi:hypothetical protein
MNITTFNPQILTNNAEPIVELFEELGFVKKHNPKGIGELDVAGIRMEDGNGFYLDISTPDIKLPHDMIAIRMNVDDFDAAYDMLLSRGFRNFYGDKTIDTGSARSAMLLAPSGYAINLIQHIK